MTTRTVPALYARVAVTIVDTVERALWLDLVMIGDELDAATDGALHHAYPGDVADRMVSALHHRYDVASAALATHRRAAAR